MRFTDIPLNHRPVLHSPSNGQPASRAMTSPSQPSGFAAYFAVQPTSSSSPSAPLIHGLTSPPRTDSPSDSKLESGKASVSESPAQQAGYGAATTPIPTPPIHAAVPKPRADGSESSKRAWKLVHDPELHPKGSVGKNKPPERRENGQGVASPLPAMTTG